jgi:hypothetical protein
MINYQAAYVLILTNSNHTTFRPLHSRETVPFKPFIGSALCSCTHHDDRLQFCCVAMNAASSHGVILPLAHTHTNTLSHAVVWSAVAAHVRPAPRPDCDWRSSQSVSSGDGRWWRCRLPDHHEQERLVTKRAPNSLPHLAGIALNYHNQHWTQMRPNWKLNCMERGGGGVNSRFIRGTSC